MCKGYTATCTFLERHFFVYLSHYFTELTILLLDYGTYQNCKLSFWKSGLCLDNVSS